MKAPKHPISAIRRAAVPLVCFQTVDPAACVAGILSGLNGRKEEAPVVEWDIVNGWTGRNSAGKEALSWYDPMTQQFPESLKLLGENSPKKLLAFVFNVQRVIDRDGVVQGIWNLRDRFKALGATLCLIGPSFTLPVELGQDVVVINEPMPNSDAMRAIVESVVTDCRKAGAAIPEKDYGEERAIDTLLGLSAFAAEQSLAMSCSKEGIDFDGLWKRKCQTIEQTPGLSVWRGGETFADIGGCENVKGYLADVLKGRNAPLAIAFMDEIEKSVAGAAGDTSGVSQDCLATLLTFMQDKESTGMIFVGPPGAAKSAVAKAAGSVTGIPTVSVDLGAMKGSLVGQSEQRLRQALGVIDAISQSRTLFIATCNSLAILPPELKRRFTLGTFFFELPDAKERAQIWKLYRKKFEIPGS